MFLTCDSSFDMGTVARFRYNLCDQQRSLVTPYQKYTDKLPKFVVILEQHFVLLISFMRRVVVVFRCLVSLQGLPKTGLERGLVTR